LARRSSGVVGAIFFSVETIGSGRGVNVVIIGDKDSANETSSQRALPTSDNILFSRPEHFASRRRQSLSPNLSKCTPNK
jgi:hypothetical protein